MLEPAVAKKCKIALGAAAGFFVLTALVGWLVAHEYEGGTSAPAVASVSPPAGDRPLEPVRPPEGVRTRAAVPVAAKAAATVPGNASSDLEREIFRLEMENARLRARLDDMLNWILDNVQGTFPLPDGQMANLRITPVYDDMSASDDLIAVLRLTPEEAEKLDGAFWTMRHALYEASADYLSAQTDSDHQATLNIGPYDGEGEAVREALYASLRNTLGMARFSRFLQISEDELEQQFDYFGKSDRMIQFEAFEDEESGATQLFIRDQRILMMDDDGLNQRIIASERVLTELPVEYNAYWSYLPEGIGRFARTEP